MDENCRRRRAITQLSSGSEGGSIHHTEEKILRNKFPSNNRRCFVSSEKIASSNPTFVPIIRRRESPVLESHRLSHIVYLFFLPQTELSLDDKKCSQNLLFIDSSSQINCGEREEFHSHRIDLDWWIFLAHFLPTFFLSSHSTRETFFDDKIKFQVRN